MFYEFAAAGSSVSLSRNRARRPTFGKKELGSIFPADDRLIAHPEPDACPLSRRDQTPTASTPRPPPAEVC